MMHKKISDWQWHRMEFDLIVQK